MTEARGLRGLHWTTVLLAAVSLSIGWGIRGNFGHEYGAMLPGGLTAIAVCLMSGRADWRARVTYFGMFGALGWAFGGSISYMQVVGYTHSGHAASQYYGFFCLFVIGFLWGGMGGAGTAFPAVADRERLTELFRPICWVFGFWLVCNLTIFPLIEQWESAYAETWSRHESPLYWFDADWIQAFTALIALFLFDIWDDRLRNVSRWRGIGLGALAAAAVAAVLAVRVCASPGAAVMLFAALCCVAALGSFAVRPVLGAFALAGALLGWVLQWLLGALGLLPALAGVVLRREGDLDMARRFAETEGIPYEAALDSFVINWPQFFLDVPQHLGWMLGIVATVCLYFAMYGRFKAGSSLLAHMAAGWFISFLVFPTLLGVRMTPPRADDWAGILGLFAGAMLWLCRQRMFGVVFAAVVSGTVGGLGFSGASCIKLLMVAPGNPARTGDETAVAAWAHWQSANWHSFLEQTYGFINGIGIALALGLLATRAGRLRDEQRQRKWTEVFAAAFVLLLLTFLNIFKNVRQWREHGAVPDAMAAPWFKSFTLPAEGWFVLMWGLMSLAGLYVLMQHRKRPIAAIPENWLGKGQLFYLVLLWIMVIANFERALPAFTAQRILTEGTIFVNAILASVMVLLWPVRLAVEPPTRGRDSWGPEFGWAAAGLAAALLVAGALMPAAVRGVYGDAHAGHSGANYRFGEKANWRVTPLEKGKRHL